MKLAHVFVEHPLRHLDHTFTYRCDNFSLQRGVRVRVPFGKTSIIGFVERVEEVDEALLSQLSFALRDIVAVIDEKPLLNEELFALGEWMADTYIVPKISCYQCMLPAKLKPSSSHGRIKQEAWIRLSGKLPQKLTKRQQAAYEALLEQKEMLRSHFYAVWKAPGKKLLEAGIAEVFMKEATALLRTAEAAAFLPLQPQQEQVVQAIQQELKHAVFLLHGVTGSGKTEVFLHLAQQVLQEGKQVMILVPEIALTPQMVKRVRSRFGAAVAIYHSGLNSQEKYEQYQLVREHKVSIVVGTRSAVFMPFDHLGLIVLDEEHEQSYKQEGTPRYHCRDIAIWRGKKHQARVVLASATPSLESYARAHKGVYRLLTMPARINGKFPKVTMVEMRKAVANKESYLLSDVLLDGIYERLQRKEQVILLLNRRGYTPILRCIACGYVQMCPHCEIAMSYHKEEQVLKCHTCGHTMAVPPYCPRCGEHAWRYLGMGTQKLEEFVQKKFPAARILRMDADTTGRKNAHEEILQTFVQGEADILLGTQMIAKGLDIDNVTLVGIINGDAMLNRSDYRSAEMTYDLLEQACGRSGRGQQAGEVILQAYDIRHYAIRCAAAHDYRIFFTQEMRYRHLAGYPPYRYLISLVFSHKQEDLAWQAAACAAAVLRQKDACRMLGPASLSKRKDEQRVRILLKGKDAHRLRLFAHDVYAKHLQTQQKARLDIDVSPVTLD